MATVYSWPMSHSTTIRSGRHCTFNLHAHLVFVTKYRKHVFTQPMLKFMRLTFEEICQRFEAEIIEFDGEKDHVHLLVNYPPKLALSKLVNSLKGVSSRLLRANFPSIEKYYWKGVLWSPSYFAGSCGNAPIEIVKQYIQQQETPS